MANRVYQFRRGTTAQNDAFRGKEGELSIDLDSMRLRIHNDVEMGGYEVPNMTDLDNYYTKSEIDTYTKTEVDTKITDVLGTATSAMDTLGEIETLFNTLKSGATNELDTLGEIATKINSLSSDVDSLQTTLSNEQTKISVLQTQMGGTSVSDQIDAALAVVDLGTL